MSFSVENFGGITTPLGVLPAAAACATAGLGGGASRDRGSGVHPGPPEAEVEPSGVYAVEQSELLDDRERGAVPELDAGRADPDVRRRGGDERDHDRRRHAGHSRVEVVLRKPVPLVPEAFGLTRQVHGVAEGLGHGRAGRDGHQIQDRERDRTRHDPARAIGCGVRSSPSPRWCRKVGPS